MIELLDDQQRPVGPFGTLTGGQALAVLQREGSLLVSANAGSGKTMVLAERYLHLLRYDGLAAGEILAISFTDKAAGELRRRIRSRLIETGGREHVRSLDTAWISTFHGVCGRILRAHAVRIGLDPEFVVLDEGDARAIRGEAFDEALAALFAEGDSADVELAAAYSVETLREIVLGLYDRCRARGERAPCVPGLAAEPPPAPSADEAAAAVRAALLTLTPGTNATVDKAIDRMTAQLALLDGPSSPPLAALASLVVKPGNANALKADVVVEALSTYERYLQSAIDAAERPGLEFVDRLLAAFGAAFERRKREQSGLDFEDLQIEARDLLAEYPAIAARYRSRFRAVLVDEFQDTNDLQLQLLDLLGEHRFVVGDALQSIYGFRHADVSIFRAARERLAAQDAAVDLPDNYRTDPEILEVLDAAFAVEHGADHVRFSAKREPVAGDRPLVEALLVDRKAVEDWPDEPDELLEGTAWRRAEARLLAARIAELVTETETETEPGDVVILMRAVGDMPLFAQALEEHGLSAIAGAGRGFWSRTQVLDLHCYLTTLANPQDEPALFGLLGSPLCGLTSDGLSIVAAAAQRGRRWTALVDAFAGGDPVSGFDALSGEDRDRLAALVPWVAAERRSAAGRATPELLDRVVDRTGYDLHVLSLPGGARRLANVRKLGRLAASFESRHGRDLRGFVDRVAEEIALEEREVDAPVEDTDGSAVRLMTIHASKGLEFPVVAVADLGRQRRAVSEPLLADAGSAGLRIRTIAGDSHQSSRHRELAELATAEAEAEERRILHVAMTRAENRLILSGPVTVKPPAGTPAGWILPRLLPDLVNRLTDEQTVGEDLVFATPAAGTGPPVRVTVRRTPISPPPRAAVASAGVQQPSGALFTQTPAPPDPPPVPATVSYSSLSAFRRCAYRYHLEREVGLREDRNDPLWQAVELARPAGGLDAAVRGSLVHRLLELYTDATPSRAEIVAVAAAEDAGDLDDERAADIERLCAAAHGSAVMARVSAANVVRREHGFLLDIAGDVAPLVNGFIDVLAIEADGGALVVDYKTDAVAAGADLEQLVAERYLIQRELYALAALSIGAPHVDVVHLYLELPEAPAIARYVEDDIEQLRARLAAACAPLLSGLRPPSDRPGRYLCRGCPARSGLCIHDEEITSA